MSRYSRDDDDDEDDDRPRSRSGRRRRNDDDDRPGTRAGFVCPYCRCNARPRTTRSISAAGWIVFVVMLFVCIPLCWIGFLMQDERKQCVECGVKLD
jgi:hypothetical protein